MFIEVSDNLRKLAKFFPENLFVVGGFVRNSLLGLPCADVDICSSVDVEEVSKRLANSDFDVKVKSLKFGTLLISLKDESYEYTAFRKEMYGKDGSHCPQKCQRTDKIEEDCMRRDFTVNSIYYNINKDVCVDICHGIVDLTDRTIRAISQPDTLFENDGERVLRMVRFSGELGFKIEKNTFISAKKFAKNVHDLQGTRRFSELEKILYCDKRYERKISSLKHALGLMNELGVWQYFDLPKKLRFKNVYRSEDRVLGFLIDVVDNVKPECLEAFLEGFLKEQFGFNTALTKKIFISLAGYYEAIAGTKNREYFEKYFDDWANIYPLLACKSKRLQQKYNFFYQYIIGHGQQKIE